MPIGPMRIEYNAHRVFGVQFLIDYFSNEYEIESFSYVDDMGLMHSNVDIGSNSDLQNDFSASALV